jgi:hypothetical protein
LKEKGRREDNGRLSAEDRAALKTAVSDARREEVTRKPTAEELEADRKLWAEEEAP